MAEPIRVLIVADSEDTARLIMSELKRAGLEATSETVGTPEALREVLARAEWDCVVSGSSMPELDSRRALEIVQETGKDLPFIVVSESIGEEAADLMRAGANDFVLKDRMARFAPAVRREVTELRARREASKARDALAAAQEAVARGTFVDQVLEQMPAGVIVAEAPSGRLLLANREAKELLGLTELPLEASERISAVDARNADGRSYAEADYPVFRAIRGETVTNEEVMLRRGNGARVSISVNAAPIRDQTGAVVLAVITLSDISERKRAEEALQESEQRYHSLFEQMSEGFALHEIICDEQGALYDYRFLDINPAFEELTGLKREDVVGRTLREVLPEEDPYWIQAYGGVALTGEPLQAERYSPALDRHFRVFAYRPAPRQFAVIFVDVTEQRRMEESVRVNLTKYSVLFNSLPIGVTVSDAEGRITEANAEAERLLSLAEDELARRKIDGEEWRIIRADGSPMPSEEYASVRALKEQRRVADVEMGIVKEGGEVTWINVTAEPVPLEGHGVVIAYTDITDRKRAEEERERLVADLNRRTDEVSLVNQRLQALMDALPVGVSFTEDVEAQRIVGNPVLLEQFGIGPSDNISASALDPEAPGRKVRYLQQGRQLSDKELPLQRAVAENRPTGPVEIEVVLPSGRRWVAEARGAPIRDAAGNSIGAVAVVVDITDRKEAEQERERLLVEMERERAWLEAIFENTEAHLVFLDRHFNFLRVNRAYAAGTRRKPEEFTGHNHFEFYPHEENEAIFRRVVETGEPFSVKEKPFEFPGMPERGMTYWDWTLVPIKGESGEVQYLVFSLMDVTEQVRQRERLVASERARAELAEDLVSEIGHRTKNNLAIVAGLLQTQLSRMEGEASAESLIEDAITRIMSFAALHEQMYQSRSDSIELLDALRRIAEINRQALGADGVSLTVEGEPVRVSPGAGTNICVMANELLTNAFKHGCSPEGACEIRVRLSSDAARLALEVWNSGNPIAEDFDVSAAGRTGLELVQSMVTEQYGGSFTISPEHGGTRASVILDKERLLDTP